jgi:hypothetical protein
MLKQALFRRILLGFALAAAALSAPVAVGSVTPAYAQVSAEFQAALEPYGVWRRSARFGEVWVPDDRPPGWRPYTEGHWVYTDEWGWYWDSDEEEADWGWVTYHYGRWAHDQRLGWFWVPDDEWAPAWVDWRRGNDYVGWAPLPPEELLEEDEYRNDPIYWVFVQPRYLIAPRLRTYYLPPQRSVIVFRQTFVVNRTVRLERNRNRFAVNPGIAPGIIGLAARRPIPTFRVQPRVVAGTRGVAGAVQVRPQDLARRGQPRPRGVNPVHATIQATKTVIQPVKIVPKVEPLGKDGRGRLGSQPPRAAQGGTIAPPRTPAPKLAPATQTPQSPAGTAPRNGAAPVTTPTTPRIGPTPTTTPTAPRTGPAPTTAPTTPHVVPSTPPPQVKPVRPPVTQTPPPQVKPVRPPVTQTPPPRVAPAVTPSRPPVVHAPPPPPAARAPSPPAVRSAPPPPAVRSAPPPAARTPPPPAARGAPPHKPAAPNKPEDKKQDVPK